MATSFTLPKVGIQTVPATNANEITKGYYDFLVGEINRGTIKRAVCKKYYPKFDYTSYHLISLNS